jgi:Tfp pilus assembly protein PilF
MSITLKMSEELMDLGRRFRDCGRDQDALKAFGRIPHLGNMSADTALEAQLELARIYLRQHKFALARRHLNIVLACDAECGEAHYLLASCFFQDDKRDMRRADKHFRRAVELEPREPAYAADYGLCLLESGKTAVGLKYLQKAVALAPDDIEYARDLALSLLTAEQPIEARRVALAALFRQPGNGDARKLWNEVRFHEVRIEQSYRPMLRQENAPEEPVLLPFRRDAARTAKRPKTLHGTLKFPLPADRAGLLKRLRKKRRQSS